MPGRDSAFEEVPGFTVMAQHLFVKYASGMRPMDRATHSGATGHASGGAAGQQCQRRSEQREDNENGLSAAHIER
ncbi:MAG: hypothetical protein ABSB65_09830 [Candidatus Acidiferrales bacterium]|jgi:hypothetical protein